MHDFKNLPIFCQISLKTQTIIALQSISALFALVAVGKCSFEIADISSDYIQYNTFGTSTNPGCVLVSVTMNFKSVEKV